jgi:hypothetical protein
MTLSIKLFFIDLKKNNFLLEMEEFYIHSLFYGLEFVMRQARPGQARRKPEVTA